MKVDGHSLRVLALSTLASPQPWIVLTASAGVAAPAAAAAVAALLTLDAALGEDPTNVEGEDAARLRRDYDGLIPLRQLVFFGFHLALIAWACARAPGWSLGEIALAGLGIGYFASAGCLTRGHELVHRADRASRILGGLLLSLVCYGTFKVEHIRGHHVWVATPHDPASARRGESLYRFLPRVMTQNPLRAFELEAERLRGEGRSPLSWRNEALGWTALSAAVAAGITLAFGPRALLFFLAQAAAAVMVLETIDYVQHYGLVRERLPDGRYEPVSLKHAWSSAGRFSNWTLLNLPRHADHHARPTRPHPLLRHHVLSPQLPHGYYVSIALALIPPLWFHIMDRRVNTQMSPQPSFERVPLPFYLRALNTFGSPALPLGLSGMSLEAPVLMDIARRSTGLSDFGDAPLAEPLGHLLASMEEAAPGRTVLGAIGTHRELLSSLTARLQIEEAVRKDPGIRDEPIEAPVFIIGMPRTGTTLLHNLMATDLSTRSALAWELRAPAPCPRPETHSSDPRIRETRQRFERMYRFVPQLRAVHPMDAQWPDECFYFFYTTFAELTFDTFSPLLSYQRWLRGIDWAPHWRYHKLQLQILQRHFPKRRWVLKAPGHISRLEALFEVYPDARVIFTHRDPAKVVASCCSLFETSRAIFYSPQDPRTLGEEWLESWGYHVNRLAEVRPRLPEGQVYDVSFDALMGDHVGEVERIYAALGLPGVEGVEGRVKAWLAANPRNKHGTHRYTLERYGLSRERVHEALKPYMDAFPPKLA